MSHYGYMRTISNFEELGKHIDDMQRHLDMLNGDGSWMGVSVDYFVFKIYSSTLHSSRRLSKHERRQLLIKSRQMVLMAYIEIPLIKLCSRKWQRSVPSSWLFRFKF